MFLLIDFGKVLCFSSNKLQQNLKCSFYRRIHSMNIDSFLIGLLCLHLTFCLFDFLSVIPKQHLEQYNYYVNQSELLTRFLTDFTSSVWNFCC